MRRLTLATVTTVLLLAGCTSGADSDGGPTGGGADSDGGPAATGSATPAPSEPTTPEAAAAPDCDEVWTAGAVLPADYTSCVTDGEEAVQDVTACTDGTSLVVYLDTFYAITGDTIVEPAVAPLQDTDEFGAAYSACTGE